MKLGYGNLLPCCKRWDLAVEKREQLPAFSLGKLDAVLPGRAFKLPLKSLKFSNREKRSLLSDAELGGVTELWIRVQPDGYSLPEIVVSEFPHPRLTDLGRFLLPRYA